MVGGGGDAQPSPPLNGGEFLLQLLKNPPQHLRNKPPQLPLPSQTLPHDPAVAAVGPSISYPAWFPSNGHDGPAFRFPPFAPHNYFNSQLGLGFPQNPDLIPNPNLNNTNSNHPNWPSSSPPGFNFMQSHPIYDQGLSDDVVKLGLGSNQQQRQQEQHNKLIFGSLHSDVLDSQVLENRCDLGKVEDLLLKERAMAMENRTRLNGLEADIQRTVDNNNRSQQFNSLGYHKLGSTMEASQQQLRRKPPPGFSSKPRALGKESLEQNLDKGKSLEQNLDKGKGYKGVMSSNGGVQVERLHLGDRSLGQSDTTRHLDGLAPSRGSKLHSVPGTDLEGSLITLHYMDNEDGRKSRTDGHDKRELDDLDEQGDSLGLEDRADEKSDKKKHAKSRDKDYRSDKRGQCLLNQRMRSYRRHVKCRRNIKSLNVPFLEIYESLMPPEEEKVKQKRLLALLEKHVTKEWPEAQLHLYGSCANSFGFCRSDIDVCLEIGDADVNKSEILLKLAAILQSDNLENVQALTRARVPIVKLMDPATGVSCDICVNNVLAVINTKLLRDYSKIDVRLRQLAFIVKHWAKSRGVNETYQGTLSSYAYVLMCIHFLQQRNPSILPCLQEMEPTYSVTVENVKCSYFDQVEKLHGFGSHNGETIAQLVWAFFNYWAYCHDYANDVISVRTGSILSKHAKDWTRRIGNDRHLICIEDPFEVSHDLGRVVDKHSIRVLREEFERAADIMQNDPNPCIALFEPYVPS